MSCRNFRFDDCFDDCVEELVDRYASQRAAQEPADARFDQLATIAARTRVSRGDASDELAFWSSHWVRAIFWYAGLVVLVCSVIGLIAFRAPSNLKQRSLASGFGRIERSVGSEVPARAPVDSTAKSSTSSVSASAPDSISSTPPISSSASRLSVAGGSKRLCGCNEISNRENFPERSH